MMNKKRSNSLARWKVLVIFPIATCLLMAWAYPIPYGHGHERQEGTRSIRGKVIHRDSDQPIPGTDIMVKGTDINTVTGEDGSYWLENVPDQAREILFFSREHGFLLVQITPTDTLVDVALSRSQLSMFRKSPDSPWRGLYPYPTVRSLKEPIYIIDGQILKGGNPLQGIDPKEIVSIRVLRDTVAAVFYGQAAKNGVVLVTTTKQFQNKNNKLYDKRDSLYQRMSRFKQDSIIRTYPGHPVYIQDTQRRLLVYVIDGEVHKGKPFYMYPDEIESMEVIRNPEAAKAYGVSAGGVIRIKTRNSDDNSGNKN